MLNYKCEAAGRLFTFSLIVTKIFYYFLNLSVIVMVNEIGESYSVHIVIDGRVLVML